MSKVHLKQYPDERPKTRGDCYDMPRPCPFVSCRHHLGHTLLGRPMPLPIETMRAAVEEHGSISKAAKALGIHHRTLRSSLEYSSPMSGDEIADALCNMEESCSLDVAEQGSKTLDEVGEVFGFTRERARQHVATASAHVRERGDLTCIADALKSRDGAGDDPLLWAERD